jgi:hypothetical protein
MAATGDVKKGEQTGTIAESNRDTAQPLRVLITDSCPLRCRSRLVRAPKGAYIRLQPKDSLFQCVDSDILMDRAIPEHQQLLREIPETRFVTDGREVLNVRIRDFNHLPFDCRPEQPENLCQDGSVDFEWLRPRALSQMVAGQMAARPGVRETSPPGRNHKSDILN